ncbi:MAG: putative dehydrogenase [Tardiphaga sp.]|jgi:predicted dehydrogenase|nr:putative dehydrogenase [Tardiphaga sp.]
MASKSIRILMDGVTGRLGQNQHLIRSLLAIRNEGGLVLANGDRLVPEPVLLGRNAEKLATLASAHGGLAWSTDVAASLADPAVKIYFDAALTAGRVGRAKRAIAAGKHIYLEKPVADSLDDALDLYRAAKAAGVKHGVVQDKVFLPGFHKLRKVRDAGFFGRILSVRLEFGWWVFDGELYPSQRSSWNYKKREGGGLILDMFPHWRYILEDLVGNIEAVSCRKTTQVPKRRDERGDPYDVDVEDEVFATLQIEGGILAQIDCSWASRVKRDDMLTMKIDGTLGSAVTTLHRCFIQPLAGTPKPVWSVDVLQATDFNAQWQEVPDVDVNKNSYRCGWELFLKHVVDGTPFPSPLLAGAKGVQLAEACYRSDAERRWIDLPVLS